MSTLSDIASLLSLPAPPGAAAVSITGIAPLSEAEPTELSLLATEAYLPHVVTSKAAALLVQRKVTPPPEWRRPVLFVDDVELAVARVLPLFAPPVPRPAVGVHPTAQISELATIGADAAIGPFVVIGPRARLGSRCTLHAGVYLGDEVTLGDDCELFPHVVVRERIQIGSRVVIHAGSVLGSDGFGYRWDGTRHAKVPQIGNVIVEDEVEIGSCVCIDRAKFSVTRIGRGTKIDNLVQVGHNVQTGPHCILVGQSGLAGSVQLGAGVLIGGQTAVRDHIRMGDGAMAAACSGVAEDVEPKTIVSGVPALPHRQTLREQTALRRLPHLLTQVRKLQEEVDALKKASTNAPDSAQAKLQ